MDRFSRPTLADDDQPTVIRPRIVLPNSAELDYTMPRLRTVLEPEASAAPAPSMTGRVLGNLIVQSLGKAVGYASSIVALALSTRFFAVSTLGDYAIVFLYLSFFGVLADFGISNIAVREAARHPDQIARVIGATLTLRAVFALVVYAAAAALVPFMPYTPEVKVGIWLLLVPLFFASLAGAFDVIFTARIQARYPTIADVGLKALVFAGTVATYGYSLHHAAQVWLFDAMISINVVASLYTVLVKWVGAARQVRLRFTLDGAVVRPLLWLALPIGVIFVLGQIHNNADALLLSLLQSNTQVAIYNLAYKVLSLLMIFFGLFAAMILPILARYQEHEGDRFRQAVRRVLNISLSVVLPVALGVMLVAPQIIALLGGGHYPQSVPPLIILAPAVLLQFLNMIYSNIAIAMNLQRRLIWVALIDIVLNISMNLYAIPRYSYIGSAVATDISEGIGMALVIAIVNGQDRAVPAPGSVVKTLAACAAMAGAVLGVARLLKLDLPGLSAGTASLTEGLAVRSGAAEIVVGAAVYGLVLLALGGVEPTLLAVVARRVPALRGVLRVPVEALNGAAALGPPTIGARGSPSVAPATRPLDYFWGLDTDLQRPLVVGNGTVLYLSGWFLSLRSDVRSITILLDGVPHRVTSYASVARDRPPGAATQLASLPDQRRRDFVAVIPIRRLSAARRVKIGLRVVLRNGERHEITAGLRIFTPWLPDAPDPALAAERRAGLPFIAICMATYNPPLDLFARQIQSIRDQIYHDWVCIITDDVTPPEVFAAMQRIIGADPRFRVYRNARNLGFYGNFERCLSLVPPGADLVALADQDDCWYPDKLRACVAALQPEDALVYTDMAIVDGDGRVIHPTFWVDRPNNFTDFKLMLFSNTVTSAASVFRADLLRDLLPFPPSVGRSYHDHWLACVAMMRGALRYIDRPLYAYVQHGGNVVGHVTRSDADASQAQQVGGLGRLIQRVRRRLSWAGQDVYFTDILRLIVFCATLRLRVRRAPARRRRVVRAFLFRARSIIRKPRLLRF